jgi:Peptidase family M50.
MTKGGSRRYDGTVIEAISSFFTISHIEEEAGVHTFKIPKSSYDPEKFRQLYYRLRASGYYVYSNGQDEIIVLKKSDSKRKGILKYLFLFITVATIIYSGYTYSSGYYVTYAPGTVIELSILFFALPIGAILFIRELPKYLLRRKRKQKYSLPILVPNPFLMGTMGIINSNEEPFLNSGDELYSGFMSLVSGFLLSALFLFLGSFGISLYTGTFVPTNAAESLLHSPLLLNSLGRGFVPSNGFLDPLSLAGWSGLTFTAFNCFPVGLMDGGFILSGLRRSVRMNISYIFLTIMVVISLTYLSWLILPLFLAFIGMNFIEPADSNAKIKPVKFLAAILIVVMVATVSLTPFPVHQTGPQVAVSESGQWYVVGNSSSSMASFSINVSNQGTTNIDPGFSTSPNMPLEIFTTGEVVAPGQTHAYRVKINTTTAAFGYNAISLKVFIGSLEKPVTLTFLKLQAGNGGNFFALPTKYCMNNGTTTCNITFTYRGLNTQNVTLMIGAPSAWNYGVKVYDVSRKNTIC